MVNGFLERAGVGLFRVIRDCGLIIGAIGSVPTPESSLRGWVFRTEGGESIADTVGVMLKDGDDAYAAQYPFFSAGGNYALDVDDDGMRVRQSRTPTSAAEACDAGTIVWDADAIYVCVAADTWKKADIATWAEE